MPKFKNGDRVGYYFGIVRYPVSQPYFGVVTQDPIGSNYSVRYDGQDTFEDNVPEDCLYFEDELKQKWSELEKTFCSVQGEIRQKLKEASDVLGNIKKRTEELGLDLGSMYELLEPFKSNLEVLGWELSSSSC